MQIVDITDPVITVPDDITVEATSNAGEPVSFSVQAQDAAEDELPYELLSCEPPSGSLFQLAAAPVRSNATTVICAASDVAGNTATADFDVIVQDTLPPTITVPGAFALEATSPDGAIADFAATTQDAVDGAGDADCVPASGSTFAMGTTLVTCNATDARTNAAAPEHFNLTVHDTTEPTLTVPDDIILEATSPAGAVATFALSASDIADPSVPVVCSANSGDTFPLGSTTVNCTATDDSTNQASASFTILVQDTTAPVIDPHADVGPIEATGPGGATVDYGVIGTFDVVDVDWSTCSPASGSTFALGTTTVDCDAEDAAGNNAAPTHFDVTVVDTTAPVIDPHANVGPIEATDPGGATVDYGVIGTFDVVDVDLGRRPARRRPAARSRLAPLPSTATPRVRRQQCRAHALRRHRGQNTTAPVDRSARRCRPAGSRRPVPVARPSTYGVIGTFDVVDVDLVGRPARRRPAPRSRSAPRQSTAGTDASGNTAPTPSTSRW